MKRFGAYLKRILTDLQEDELVQNPEVSVLGWSMGGLAALHLAALDETGLLPVDVRRFVAINPPPTSFERGLKPFTKVMEASRAVWEKEVDIRKPPYSERYPGIAGLPEMKQINRISRVIGHLEHVKKMIEKDEDCADVLNQLSASKSALNGVGKEIINEHITHCIAHAIEDGDMAAIEEFQKAIEKFY